LDDCPRRAERRLLVAHLEIAPNKEIEQLTALPDFGEIEYPCSALSDDPRSSAGRVIRNISRG
jgi:hypothetical protein